MKLDPNRRQFPKNAARTTAGLCGVGVILGLQQQQANAKQGVVLRPPGALTEKDFLAACTRCGQCVQACPYDMLHLASLISPMEAGTPYFIARDKPCEMCPDIPCMNTCPSGALSEELKDINDARISLAVLLDHETCLNWQGLRCDVCYRVCPLIDKAITLEKVHNDCTRIHAKLIPTVHSDLCTGCGSGKCEQAFVLEEAAIKVLPMDLAKGLLGHHYRLGWKEKQNAGKALLEEQHPDDLRPAMDARMPEGMSEPTYQFMEVKPNQKVATPNRATQDYIANPTTVDTPEHFPNLDLNIKGVK